MTTDGIMMTADEDVMRVAESSDRRPDFCAEALSPRVRIGLFLALMFAVGTLFFSVLAMAIWPKGVLAIGFPGVMLVGVTIALGFFMMLVFGALLGNNPRLNKGERIMWYTLFAIAGPVALPSYWLVEVWPIPYEPSPAQRL